MDLKIIYEDNALLVVDKPAGIIVFSERKNDDGEPRRTIADFLIEKYPQLKNVGEAPRYGIVHRLDKDTSGILLVAKTNETLIFLQKQFKNREAEKKYIALVVGNIKEEQSEIKTLMGRAPGDKRKQKVYLAGDPTSAGKREAFTKYKVLKRYEKYTLLEVKIKTGRRHQIRCHFSYLRHPIAGDKMYSFKDSFAPEGLNGQFLHAAYLKIKIPNGETKEFRSELPEELKIVLDNFKI
ncbi:MAG: 23S rRNA pseudouridine synthase [Parcubacteria group bacterium Licking1014_1]|nr:MAG: 23S rRNA pseudouridine synthase [Parcubacteria group bacterium Licking1014_1]